MTLTESIKAKGLELGFSHVGVTTMDNFPEYEAELLRREDYALWTDPDRSKYPGRSYLIQSAHPVSFYPEGKSIICATFGYSQYLYPEELTPYVGRAYLCRAYVPQAHSAAGIRVAEFRQFIQSLGIGLYDGPGEVPERAACARAGIITYGKNNFAYTPEDGSFNILYTFLADAELDYDTPTVRCDCPPDCRACMDACPGGAIIAPGRLHPQHCVLYNNQLPPEKIPREIRPLLGTHVHGCDECQTACPRNQAVLRKAARTDPFLEVLKEKFDLEKLLLLDDSYYQEVVRPIMYNYITDLDILRSNAAIAMGNSGNTAYLPALKRALASGSPSLQEAAQWAIDRLSSASE